LGNNRQPKLQEQRSATQCLRHRTMASSHPCCYPVPSASHFNPQLQSRWSSGSHIRERTLQRLRTATQCLRHRTIQRLSYRI